MSPRRRKTDRTLGTGYEIVQAAFEDLAGLSKRDEGDELETGGLTNEQIADLAFPQYARKGQRKARPRQNLLRSLQRHQRGTRVRWDPKTLRRISRVSRAAAMHQLYGTIEVSGVTVELLTAWIVISPPNAEYREIKGPWYIPPSGLREAGFFPPAYAWPDEWFDLAVAFFRAFFRAYGLEAAFVDELEELRLHVGGA